MSNNPTPPTISQAELDQVTGRKNFGLFEQVLSAQVNEAKECVTACEILIKDHISDPEQEPSETDVKMIKSFYNRMLKHLDLLKTIPSSVTDKKNLPTAMSSSRRKAIASEIDTLLEELEYTSTLSNLSETIGKYELWFITEGIEMGTVQPRSNIPSNVDHDSAMGKDGSKRSDSSIPIPNPNHEKFSYDEPVYLDRSTYTSHQKELEPKATAFRVIEKSNLRENGTSKRVPTVPSGPIDSVLLIENTIREHIDPARTPSLTDQRLTPKSSPANSIRSARIKVQEPKPTFPSNQPKADKKIPSELRDNSLHKFEKRQTEKERENKRAQDQLLQKVANMRKKNHSLHLKLERSGRNPDESEGQHRCTPKSEKFKCSSPKPEIKPESKNLLFSSSNESEEDASYDEKVTSQYDSDSEYRYPTGQDNQYQSNHNLRKRVAPRNRTYRQKKVRLDDVRKNLISFDGTGRFTDFQTIFYDEVMENKDIKPFMKLVLLKEHLTGEASEFIYELNDPLDAIKRTFQDLRKTFGGKADKMTLHDKFNSLPFSKTDSDKMIKDIAAHRRVMAQLEEKKVDINDIRSITTFTKKLPSRIGEKVIKYLAKTTDSDVDFEKFLDIVEDQIRVIKTSKSVLGGQKIQGSNEFTETKSVPIHYTKTRAHQNSQYPQQTNGIKLKGNYQYPNSGQRGTADNELEALYKPGKPQPKWNLVASSFPFNVPEQGQKCGACEGQHKMVRCPLTSNEFRKKLQEKNLCERCTMQGHNADQCTKWYTCGYCHGDHAMGACPMKEFFRKRENIPSFCVIKDENSPKETFFRRHGKTSSQ